jgi:hypothetical protein
LLIKKSDKKIRLPSIKHVFLWGGLFLSGNNYKFLNEILRLIRLRLRLDIKYKLAVCSSSAFTVGIYLAYFSTLKMEATCFSETSVHIQRSTCRYIHKVTSLLESGIESRSPTLNINSLQRHLVHFYFSLSRRDMIYLDNVMKTGFNPGFKCKGAKNHTQFDPAEGSGPDLRDRLPSLKIYVLEIQQI